MTFRLVHHKTLSAAAILASICAFSGCSVNRRDIGEKYRAQIDQVVEEFREMSSEIPREELDLSDGPLEPAPYYHLADGLSNMAVMSRFDLDGEPHDINDPNYFTLFSTARLQNNLQSRYLAEPAENPEQYEAELKAIAELPYVLAYDLIDYRPAVFTEDSFDVQPMRMTIALYDRRSKQWRACKLIEIAPPEEIEFEYKKWQKEDSAHSKIKEHFRTQAQKQIAAYVTKQLGGSAEFDMYAEVRK